MSPEALQDWNTRIHEWSDRLIQARINRLLLTVDQQSQLVKSMRDELIDLTNELPRYQLSFRDSGRFVDMFKPNMRFNAPALEEWLERRGIVEAMTPYYMERHHLKIVPPDIARRIAWGIAKNRLRPVATGKKSYHSSRTKRWWNKAKRRAIYELQWIAADWMRRWSVTDIQEILRS